MYAGLSGAFSIVTTATGFIITGTADGTDTLVNVERVSFQDRTYTLVNTAVTDTTAPVVASFDPGAGATGVDTAGNIVVTFNEVVRLGHTGTIRIVGADRDFTLDLANPGANTSTWEHVIQRLRAETMPPAGRPRPSGATPGGGGAPTPRPSGAPPRPSGAGPRPAPGAPARTAIASGLRLSTSAMRPSGSNLITWVDP